MSGFKWFRSGVTIFPEALKTRSDGELVAQTERYFIANCDMQG